MVSIIESKIAPALAAHVAKSVQLPNGIKLQYVEQGDPAGVPVIFLHGVTDSWRSFEGVLPFLPASVRAISLTQRGHGDADRPATYRTREFAADVADFMGALGIEAAIVAGHSMGAINAKRFALDFPERTRGLVVVGGFATMRGNAVFVEFWETAVATLTDPIDPAFAREFQESTLAQPVPPAFLDMVVQESLKVPARVWQAAFAGLLEDDFATELDRIAAPTLIVWGDQDAFRHRTDQGILAAKIAGSRLDIYPGAGHAVHWEEPERFAADLVAFVERVAG